MMTNQVFIERKRLTVLIGCRYDTIDRMVERGELPRPIRLGRNGRYRFIRAEIEPALKQHGIDLAKLEAAHAESAV
ncbi:helix-turn-helix transcriptional regulator [Aeromonas hydrophila]|jgi:predicted DNA-binding transcriptional regulator AlpA|uniref:helix-turn-helix transcriptional regulator n=1 Tax=Aeromonas hydrophila TaxID=644 RepID=UPI003BD6A904